MISLSLFLPEISKLYPFKANKEYMFLPNSFVANVTNMVLFSVLALMGTDERYINRKNKYKFSYIVY